MKSLSLFFFGAALMPLAAATLHAADEPQSYVLAKAESPKAGTIVHYSNVMKMENGSAKIEKGGKALSGTVLQEESIERTTEYLEGDEGVRSLLTKSDHFWTFTFNGHAQKSEDPRSPLIGEPVISKEKDGKWTSVMEHGKKLDEDGQKELDDVDPGQDRKRDLTLYGTEPRKPGDKWNVDPEKIPTYMDVEKPKGTISVEFAKLGEVDGEPCAELHIVFDLTGGPESGETKIHAKGEYVVHRSVKDLINRSGKVSEETEVINKGDQWDAMIITGKEVIEETIKVTGP